jgi:hypothetical protein
MDEGMNRHVLEQKLHAISSAAQPPSRPQRSERDLLEEVVENTRILVRELQSLPSWQRFTIDNPQVKAAVEALLQRDKPAPQGSRLARPRMYGV